MEGLVTSYAEIKAQFIKNSKSLEEFATQQQKKQEDLAKSLISLQDANKSGNEEIKKQNESFEKNLLSLVEKLRKENKDFYLDFEETVKIKLDENKSGIKQLIENERSQIKEIFERELSKRTDEIVSKQKGLQTTFWIIGVILVILNVVVLIKLFK